MFFCLMDINNLEYLYQSFIQILKQNPLNPPLIPVRGLIGYAQQNFHSPICKQRNTASMNSQNSRMPLSTHGTSETLTKIYCLNLPKQQER